MIISASYKTDIPAFYSTWFMNRLRAGFCAMVNPYNQRPIAVGLEPQDVEGIVFWTKNIGPLMPHLAEVCERGFPFVVQHTINGYAQSRFEAVVNSDDAVRNMHAIYDTFGPRVTVWRYDPIVLSSKTTIADHRENFAQLARQLAGAVDEVVVSFVQPYKKTRRNMAEREDKYADFSWFDRDRFVEVIEERSTKDGVRHVKKLVDSETSRQEKLALAQEMADIAANHNMHFSICSQETFVELEYRRRDAPIGRIGDARCVDTPRLLEVAQSPQFAEHLKTSNTELCDIKQNGNRGDCACFASRDIGDYDTCPYGCAYCYAVSNREVARRQFAAHDPTSVFLDSRLDLVHADYIASIPARLAEKRNKQTEREKPPKHHTPHVEQKSMF